MHPSALYLRSILFHWRVHLATALAAVVAATVLTGALVVGDSMRGSLRDEAVAQLGPVDCVLTSWHSFSESLADELARSPAVKSQGTQLCPAVMARGSISQAESGQRAGRISVLGVDRRFWALAATPGAMSDEQADERSVVLNESLARAIGAHANDDVLIRLERPSRISGETLLGRRDEAIASLRLTVRQVLNDGWPGQFNLTPGRFRPRNAFVPMQTLQRAFKQQGRVNTILASGPTSAKALQDALDHAVTLADLGLTLRIDQRLGYVAMESDSVLIEPPAELAAMEVARSIGASAVPVSTYLANEISIEETPSTNAPEKRHSIPYSTLTAIDLHPGMPMASLMLADGQPATPLRDDEILLNSWAADQLHAKLKDSIRLTCYTVESFGRLGTQTRTFTLRGVVRMVGLAADRRLVPDFEGITNATRISDWKPPFPIDLGRIRPQDEAYWHDHGPTPKAFISMVAGESMWGESADRSGHITSIRLGPLPHTDLATTASRFSAALLGSLSPTTMGLVFEPVRENALAAARGGTDFGMLFVGFSFFLIIAATILTALLFRLGVERRSGEVGILLALGLPPRTVRRLLLAEGATLAAIASAIGAIGSLGYASLMLAGLRSWWATGVNAPRLSLHATLPSLAAGAGTAFVAGVLSIVWALRGWRHASVRSLMSGALAAETAQAKADRGRRYALVSIGASLFAGILIVSSLTSKALSETAAFFGSGVLMLVACVCLATLLLASVHRRAAITAGPGAITRMGIRNAARRPRRSLQTIALIAFASFILVSTGMNQQTTSVERNDRSSGTGGYSLVGESTIPILQDLNRPTERMRLRLPATLPTDVNETTVMPLRLRNGDEASCLNLYRPRSPRIVGATEAMIRRGGFAFQSSMTLPSRAPAPGRDFPENNQDVHNPWSRLQMPFADGAVPAIGDYNTIKWMLHLGLGSDLVISDERGRLVRLRIVAMLAGSVLQSELVIAEKEFVRLFPSINGYGFFLIDAPTTSASQLAKLLESGLADYGFDVMPSTDRMAQYMSIENTYLSTFQMLGGLGMILGTLGLAAVLLRNAFERRGELALLEVLGYRRFTIRWMMIMENSALLGSGLVAGALPALLAMLPHLRTMPSAVHWGSISFTLIAVALTGTLAGALVALPALRRSLLASLRGE